MNIATAAQMRAMDDIAIHQRGIPSTLLMERAARGILEAVCSFAEPSESPSPQGKFCYVPDASGCVISEGETVEYHRPGGPHQPKAAIFSGPGNNGGDGVAVAGLLVREGWAVRAFLVGNRAKMTPDSLEMERRLTELGGQLEDFRPGDPEQMAWAMSADVIVDAIFGIGLNSDIRGDAVAAIDLINSSPAPVVAADIASGVETDTGKVLGTAVKADRTVTFTLPKAGHFVGKGGLHTGALTVHDIGIPPELLASESYPTESVEGWMVKGWLPERPEDGHKGTFGKVYVLAGSVGYTGAPVLASRAAVRSGSGLVFLGVPEPIYPIVAVKSDEAMPSPLPAWEDGTLDRSASASVLEAIQPCQAVLAGPGLGCSPGVREVIHDLLDQAACPVVLDADGINAIAEHIDELDARRDRVTILTPHDGEFARLPGGNLSDGDRIGAARAFARDHGCILVLKGHCTITAAPDGRVWLNTTGNAGMAKGGSGDVLGGMILSLLGQGMEPALAAAAAVWLHGRAGDLCARQLGQRGMTPSDMVEMLPRAFLLNHGE